MNPTDQHTPDRRQAAGMLFYLQALAAAKRALWRWPLLITVVVTAASFLIPNTYRADVTILPPESDFQSTKAMGGLKGYFASELALPVMATPSDILAEVLKSRRVRDSVVAALDLAARWNITPTKAASDLQREMLVSVEKTGVIVVGVSNNDRWFSDTLVNTLVTAADRVNRSIVNTKARRTREFVEGRLADTESDLLAAGEALQKFQNEHRTVALDAEIAALIENAAKLRARITSDEIELSVLEGSLSPEHYRIQMLRRSIDETTHRLRELESPQESDSSQTFLGMGLQELPGLAQRLAMLVRDVRIAEALFELLSEQYEQARIQETRDTPTFSVLDWAENGGRKVFPRRLFVAIAVLCSTFGLIAGWILLRVYMNQLQTADPEQHAALMGFYRTLRGGKPQTTSGEHK